MHLIFDGHISHDNPIYMYLEYLMLMRCRFIPKPSLLDTTWSTGCYWCAMGWFMVCYGLIHGVLWADSWCTLVVMGWYMVCSGSDGLVLSCHISSYPKNVRGTKYGCHIMSGQNKAAIFRPPRLTLAIIFCPTLSYLGGPNVAAILCPGRIRQP
jgi:hypothetical protein